MWQWRSWCPNCLGYVALVEGEAKSAYTEASVPSVQDLFATLTEKKVPLKPEQTFTFNKKYECPKIMVQFF